MRALAMFGLILAVNGLAPASLIAQLGASPHGADSSQEASRREWRFRSDVTSRAIWPRTARASRARSRARSSPEAARPGPSTRSSRPSRASKRSPCRPSCRTRPWGSTGAGAADGRHALEAGADGGPDGAVRAVGADEEAGTEPSLCPACELAGDAGDGVVVLLEGLERPAFEQLDAAVLHGVAAQHRFEEQLGQEVLGLGRRPASWRPPASGPDRARPRQLVKSTTGTIPTVRVTEKGQVAIPKQLRDELGIGAGDRSGLRTPR